jgi:capsular polysaccharide transport system permease protein
MTKISKPFLFSVIVPTLLVAIFFCFIATPVYRSTTSLMVTNGKDASSSLNNMLSGGTGDSMTGAFITKEFITSWQEFKTIDGADNGIQALWGRGDPITSYIKFLDSDVALYNYYKRNVVPTIDKKSGIITVESYAHSSKDAHTLNTILLLHTEEQINKLNLQKQMDSTKLAQQQLTLAQKAVEEDNAAIAAFRKRTGFYKPDIDYQATMVAQSSIDSNLSVAKADYNGVNGSTPNNPAVGGMKDKITSYRKDTAVLAARSNAINAVAKQYDVLESKRQMDLAMLEKAGQLVQDTSVKSGSDHYYLQKISEPSEPNDAEFPRALLNTFLAFCFFLLVFKFIVAPRLR